MSKNGKWYVFYAPLHETSDRYNQLALDADKKEYFLSLCAPFCVAEDFTPQDKAITYLADELNIESLNLLIKILDNEGYICREKIDFSDFVPNRYDRFYTDSDDDYIDYLEIDNLNSTYSIELSRTTEILDMHDKYGFLIGGIYVSRNCFKALASGISEIYKEVKKK